MRYFYLALFLILGACAKTDGTTAAQAPAACRGIYFVDDVYGHHKYNEFFSTNFNSCATKSVGLTNWEETSLKFTQGLVTCTPQTGINSQSLVAANNFYAYRDGKAMIDLDSSTGIYRKLLIGSDADGKALFSKTMGCFYQRTGQGPDASFGNQLLLDAETQHWASSESTDALQIYNYTISGPNVLMNRFDATADWSYQFCLILDTPDEYCAARRNGNIMFEPDLSLAQTRLLEAEAILIRTKYNWTLMPTADFNTTWNTIESTRTESQQAAWIYTIIPFPDVPPFTYAAWRSYLMGKSSRMPVVTSSGVLPICYPGSQNVTLAGGTTGKVYGEICYTNGVYTFTQN